jgi:hypothetical protein
MNLINTFFFDDETSEYEVRLRKVRGDEIESFTRLVSSMGNGDR